MTMKTRSTAFVTVGITAGALCLFVAAATRTDSPPSESARTDKPTIRIVSPPEAGFLMGPRSGTRVLIAVEIVDYAEAGIVMNDFGVPRFVEPNRNVELFVDHIVARGTYTDNGGHTVIQIFSEVPADKLRSGEYMITPPVDFGSIPSEIRQRGFAIPDEAMLEGIDFNFQVKDRRGVSSEVSRLMFAFASGLFQGPYPAPPATPKEKKPSDQ